MKIKTIVAAVAAAGFIAALHSTSVHAQAASQPTQAASSPAVTVSAAAATTVTVEPGDSLSKIATRHQTTYVRIYDANPKIEQPDLIYPGDELRVPATDEQLASRPLPGTVKATAPAPAPQPAASAPARSGPPAKAAAPAAYTDGGVWDRLALCESGGNWAINTGNGFYGGLQFTLASWQGVGGSGYPHQAGKAEQIARAQMLLARQGWGAWPACSAKLGLR